MTLSTKRIIHSKMNIKLRYIIKVKLLMQMNIIMLILMKINQTKIWWIIKNCYNIKKWRYFGQK